MVSVGPCTSKIVTEIDSAAASFFVRGSEGNSQRSLRTQARVPRITEAAQVPQLPCGGFLGGPHRRAKEPAPNLAEE